MEHGNGNAPLLEARGISKAFLHVQALDNVDFRVYPGEVVALVGDNGAGKSTLMKTLCGAYQADAGSIEIDGQPATIRNPHDAMALGIAVVYQDLALVNHRDVATNVFLGREPTRGPTVDKGRMVRESREVLQRLKIKIPSVYTLVGLLSGGQRQAVAIARAVLWGSHIVVLDEPAAALGVKQTEIVLSFVERLRAHGVACIFISHNMQHVMRVADRIVLLRLGEKIFDGPAASTNAAELVAMMTGATAARTV